MYDQKLMYKERKNIKKKKLGNRTMPFGNVAVRDGAQCLRRFRHIQIG